jgi:hypothetical protein
MHKLMVLSVSPEMSILAMVDVVYQIQFWKPGTPEGITYVSVKEMGQINPSVKF